MILLVKPEATAGGFSLDMALKTESLELEYIMAMLKDRDMPSYIYEASFETQSFEQILSRYRPQAVAITGYITQESFMLSCAKRSKDFDPSLPTIIGGPHAQLNYERFCIPQVSYICRSDNIFALAQVLEWEGILPCDSPCPPEAIDGLCHRDEKGWRRSATHCSNPTTRKAP